MGGGGNFADAQSLIIGGRIYVAVIGQQGCGGEDQAHVFVDQGRFANSDRRVIHCGDLNLGCSRAAQAILVGDGVAKVGSAMEIGVGHEKHVATHQLHAAMRCIGHAGDGEHGAVGV